MAKQSITRPPRILSVAPVTLLSILSIYLPFLAAQQPPPAEQKPAQPAPEATFSVEVELVQFPVSVTDERFRAFSGLRPENFEVYEDGVRQQVVRVEEQDTPISVGLVFDASGSVGGMIEVCRDFARAFFRFANPKDEYFLVEFGSRPVLLVPFTSRLEKIVEMVGAARSGGRTAFYDAVYMALAEMQKAHNKRKVLLLLSDGGENLSTYEEGDVRAFYAQTESTVQIYTIGVFDPLALRYVAEAREGVGNMGRLAEMSGGRNFMLSSRGTDARTAVPEIASKISRELRAQYEVGYHPSNEVRDGRWRQVRVEVKAPEGAPPSDGPHASWLPGGRGDVHPVNLDD